MWLEAIKEITKAQLEYKAANINKRTSCMIEELFGHASIDLRRIKKKKE
jgi:hypothetical protein